jgi:hypothetical protein
MVKDSRKILKPTLSKWGVKESKGDFIPGVARPLAAEIVCPSGVFRILQRGGLNHGERGSASLHGGLGAEPPAGSRGRAPGQGVRGASPP